jgi:hypothetical protein
VSQIKVLKRRVIREYLAIVLIFYNDNEYRAASNRCLPFTLDIRSL